MLGLILCGGQSSRMDSDKGLLTLKSKTWAQTAVDKMETLHFPVKVSVNEQQYIEYVKIFQPDQLVKDERELAVQGPLLGILSCYIQHPDQDIFVMACDMPLMGPVLLKELYGHYLRHPKADAYVYTNDEEPEPLCAIYTSKALAFMLDLYKNGRLVKYSMKFVLNQIAVSAIPLQQDQKPYFKNFNASAELNGL